MRPNAGRGARRPNNANRGGAQRGHSMGSRGRGRGMDTSRLPSLMDTDRPAPLIRDPPPGPLVTNHLQDLDMELALLKLKREIIEQQHQMLSGDRSDRYSASSSGRQNQYSYDQPQQSYAQPQRFKEPGTNSFAQYYDNPPPATSQSRQRHGSKRAAAWAQAGPAKRARPEQPRAQPASAPRPRPLLTDSKSNQWSPKPKDRRDFQPAKAPAKSRPGVAKPTPHFEKSRPMPSNIGLVLRPGEAPTRQQLGRMEFGLGAVVKEMRESWPEEMAHMTVNALRVIKQTIRDRIHAIMVGKPIGPGPEIVCAYRAAHPKDTDFEVIKIGLAAAQNNPTYKLAMSIIESDNPETFFKTNFNKLLNIKLNEMFSKLQDVYDKEEQADGNKTLQTMIRTFLIDEGLVLAPLVKEETEASKKPVEVKSEESKETEKETNANDETKAVKVENDTTVSKEDLIVVDTVGETNVGENKESDEKDESKNGTVDDKETANDQKKDANVDEKNDTDLCEDAKDPVASESNQSMSANDDSKLDINKEQVIQMKFKTVFYTKLIDALLKKRLPLVLPKYKNHIIRILNNDQEYKNTMGCIIAKTKKRELDAKEAGDDTSSNANMCKPPLLFVKVLGRPNLPRRNKMQAFLDQFHPAAIKKHRGVHNLLFVGFDTKEDFDNILAATNTVIDKSTLDIKESKKTNKNENEENTNAPNTNDNETTNNSDSQIDTELDNQINDLLNSIREDEENKLKETEEKLNESLNEDDVQIISEKEISVIDVDEEKSGETEQLDLAMSSKPDEKPDVSKMNVDENNTDKSQDNEQDNETITVEDEVSNEATANIDNLDEEKKTDDSTEATDQQAEEKTDANEEAKDDNIEAGKQDVEESGRPTPVKASEGIVTSTPSTVKTRRASRLAQNQNN